MEVLEERRPDGTLVGEGPLPHDLNRLNWGAVLLPSAWALVHGLWAWFGILLGWRVIATALLVLIDRTLADAGVLRAIAVVAVGAGNWAVQIPFALRANALYWRHERDRVARQSDRSVPRWPAPVAGYVASQRKWLVVGGAFVVATLVISGPPAIQSGTSATSVLIATGALDLAAIGWLWSRDRRRLASVPEQVT